MKKENYHLFVENNTYVSVVLPVAVPKTYTYSVPTEMEDAIHFGIRVEVQFGKSKRYAAIVVDVHSNPPEGYKPKPIISVIDKTPVIQLAQYKLWQWMASYYCCTIGEVMNAAMPSGLKLSSETRILLSPAFDENYQGLSDKEFMITEALSIQNELSLDEIKKILNQKTVYPLIHQLLDKKIIYLKEELKTKYKVKKIRCVRLQEPYLSQPNLLNEAFDKVSRSGRQMEALMAYIQISKQQDFVRRQEIYKAAKVDSGVINAIIKKEIFEGYDKEVSRIGAYEQELIDSFELSDQQTIALENIKTEFEKKKIILLHGVTGSGKTRVYIELIQEALDRGEQVLYLLPEIALTAQIVGRLQKIFGNDIAVYHSRLNNNERVEMWKSVLANKAIVLGARSGLFLPFNNLKLIIVDEEHDTSYKQIDPAPRYNARDSAIYLAHLYNAKVILGTATPSIESYSNVNLGKYSLVEMKERFGGLELPEMVVVDASDEMKKRKMQSHFSSVLIEELKAALERGEQAILFQNRRGYSPTTHCTTCGWHAECIHCDVTLTFHKFHGNLRCHYCGYRKNVPNSCPACGNTQLNTKGFGTEKIADELKIYLPEAKIGRMDFDTVRGKDAHARLINDFEEKRLDILVGTQMVTKGLDFDNVGIVGVLSADQLLQFPDFRASERGFQLITQVSGRAGRKRKRGKVIIQAYNIAHPVLREVVKNEFHTFYAREINERKTFAYPPYVRLIKITLKHKKPQILNDAGRGFAHYLKQKLGDRVIGPAVPGIPRVRSFYLLDVMIKLERNKEKINFAKQCISEATKDMHTTQGFSTIRVNIDVDPY